MEDGMIKNKSNHYVPDFEHQRHGNIKNHGVEASYDPLHDYSPVQLAKEKIKEVTRWFERQKGVQLVLLIGSYARGEERNDSDVDFIIEVDNMEQWLTDYNWLKNFGDILDVYQENYEQVKALRVYYQNSLELEFGFVSHEWLNQPYDKATKEALDAGYNVLIDCLHYF